MYKFMYNLMIDNNEDEGAMTITAKMIDEDVLVCEIDYCSFHCTCICFGVSNSFTDLF
jgi:hypothetical protein